MLHAVLRHFKGESFTLTQKELDSLAAGNAEQPLSSGIRSRRFGCFVRLALNRAALPRSYRYVTNRHM